MLGTTCGGYFFSSAQHLNLALFLSVDRVATYVRGRRRFGGLWWCDVCGVLSVISWVSAVEGCPLSRVPLYFAPNVYKGGKNEVTGSADAYKHNRNITRMRGKEDIQRQLTSCSGRS